MSRSTGLSPPLTVTTIVHLSISLLIFRYTFIGRPTTLGIYDVTWRAITFF
jgi:hypothetical protein